MFLIIEDKRIYRTKTVEFITDNINISLDIEDSLYKRKGKNHWKYKIVGTVDKESTEYRYSVNYYELTILKPSTEECVQVHFNEKENVISHLVNNKDIVKDLKCIKDITWNLNENIYLQNTTTGNVDGKINNLLAFIRGIVDILDNTSFQRKTLFKDIWSGT